VGQEKEKATIPCEILEYLLQTCGAQPCRVKVPPQKSEKENCKQFLIELLLRDVLQEDWGGGGGGF
jgi:hypothetical protein